MTRNKSLLQIGNVFFLIGTVILNGLSNGTIRPGVGIGDLSDKYFTLFAPAGLTFSIWGVIYTFLIGFAIYQARDIFRANKADMPWLTKMGPLFILSCLCNMVWLVVWLYEYIGIALLLMLGLWGSLFLIYLRIGREELKGGAFWWVKVPFSIYLAWICVATIANVSAWLVSMSWEPLLFSAEMWTVVMVIIAGILGAVIAFVRRDIPFALVFLWAIYGIYVKHAKLGEMGFQSIMTAAMVGMGLVGLGGVGSLVKDRLRKTG